LRVPVLDLFKATESRNVTEPMGLLQWMSRRAHERREKGNPVARRVNAKPQVSLGRQLGYRTG
jgi:hypothetical protein